MSNAAAIDQPTATEVSASGHDTTRRWLAVATILGLFAYITIVTVYNVANKELANVALGFLLGTAGSSVYGFYFGTSVGSVQKEATIAKMSEEKSEATVQKVS